MRQAVHSRILAGVVDHCRSIAGWDVVGAVGQVCLFRARGVKKSAYRSGEKILIFTAKRSDYGTGRMRYLFVLLLASGLINHFAMVGATAVKVWLRCMKFADFVTGMLARLCADQCRWG